MKRTHDLDELRKKSEPIEKYLKDAREAAPAFSRRLNSYVLDKGVARRIKCAINGESIFVFSAEWCPDCHRNVPVLKLIKDATGIEVNVFGYLEKGNRDAGELWKTPPSPPEVSEFEVRKIPLIVVLNREGQLIGEIVENPPEGQTLEGALLDILEAGSG